MNDIWRCSGYLGIEHHPKNVAAAGYYQQAIHIMPTCVIIDDDSFSVRLLLMRSFSIKWGRYTFQPFTITIPITTQVLVHQPQTIVWRTYISIDQTPGDAFEGSFDDSYAHEGSRLNDEVESGTMWCSFVVSSY